MNKKDDKTKKVAEVISEEMIASPIWERPNTLGAVRYQDESQTICDGLIFEVSELKQEIVLPKFGGDILSLPTGVGDVVDAEVLYLRTKDLISQVANFPNENALVFCANYAFSTWVYDIYDYICYLALLGLPGSGKSTVLQALARLCFRSVFFSGAASFSAIFRTLDSAKGTLCLEEAQQSASDFTSDFHKMLAVGNNKLGNIPRATQKTDRVDFVPEVYSVFGPKILCGRSIPGDDAILSRIFGVTLKPLSLRDMTDLSLAKTSDIEWQLEAERLKNDLLLYRQTRLAGKVSAPNLIHELGEDIFKLSPRDNQVYEWLLKECPSSKDLRKLFAAILDNKDKINKRKEEHLEPSILYTIYDLLSGSNSKPHYLTSVANDLEDKYGLRASPRQISTICEQNDIERGRNKNGRYLVATADQIADRIVQLGYSDPRNSTHSAPLAPINSNRESF